MRKTINAHISDKLRTGSLIAVMLLSIGCGVSPDKDNKTSALGPQKPGVELALVDSLVRNAVMEQSNSITPERYRIVDMRIGINCERKDYIYFIAYDAVTGDVALLGSRDMCSLKNIKDLFESEE